MRQELVDIMKDGFFHMVVKARKMKDKVRVALLVEFPKGHELKLTFGPKKEEEEGGRNGNGKVAKRPEKMS